MKNCKENNRILKVFKKYADISYQEFNRYTMSKIDAYKNFKDLIREFDANKDGKMSRSEKDEMKTSIFSVLDENKDYDISESEGEKFLQNKGIKASFDEFIKFLKDFLYTKETKNKDGTTTTSVYNFKNQLEKIIQKNSDGEVINTTEYAYHPNMKISKKTVRDENGNTKERVCDTDGYATSEINKDSNGNIMYTIEYKYHDGKKYYSQIITRQANGKTNEINYNAKGYKINEIDKDSEGNITYSIELKYHPNDKFKQQTIKYQNNKVKEINYNSDGCMINEILKDSEGNIISTTEYVYHKDGKLAQHRTLYQNGTMKMVKYDSKGNQIKKTEYDKDGKVLSKYIYQYNSDNLCIAARGKSQISNENYSGDIYEIIQDGMILTAINQSSGETVRIDLNKILKNYPKQEIPGMILTLNNLPGEVLFDLSVEGDMLNYVTEDELKAAWSNNGGKDGTAAGAYYTPTTDVISVIDNDRSGQNLVHELGHAIDNIKNTDLTSIDEKFIECYNIGIERFERAGHKKYDYGSEDNKSGTYCTASSSELWAEIYVLLMLGDCNSADILKTYFSEAIEYFKSRLNYIRGLGNSERHVT